jgi:hypothetical protein
VNEDRTNWPIIVGITAGVLGGIAAGIAIHAMRSSKDSSLTDAQSIIERCHDKIREIETSLERLNQPIS